MEVPKPKGRVRELLFSRSSPVLSAEISDMSWRHYEKDCSCLEVMEESVSPNHGHQVT